MACAEGTNIFSSGAGKVMVIDDDTATPFLFAVDEARVFNDLKGICTSVGIHSQSGFQFTHALREFIYVYVFTERVGEIIVNGLAFPASCVPLGPQDVFDATEIPGAQCTYDGLTGLERVQKWYECNRITTRANSIAITLGATAVYDAFLVGMKIEIANAETGIAQFSARFNFIPHTSAASDFCFSTNPNCDDPDCE